METQWGALLELFMEDFVSFFLIMNIKEDILKNVGNWRVDGLHWLPQWWPDNNII